MDQNPAKPNLSDSNLEILSQLTPRRAQILQCYFKQPDENRVASALGLSPSTVRNQIAIIMAQVGVGSRAELMQLMQKESRRN